MVKVSTIVNDLLKNLTPRQKEFLEERFGLKDNNRKTLQELGDRHDITRERVRQIETEGLKLAADNFKKSGGPELISIAKNHLDLLGGVRKEDYLVEDFRHLLKDSAVNKNQLRFIFAVAHTPEYYNEDEDFHSFWFSGKSAFKKATSIIDKAAKLFSSKKDEMLFQNQASTVMAKLAGASASDSKQGTDFTVMNYLLVSKKFGVNPFNDFGLSEWEEITPKTARSKAYLILKKHGKPLHFREIAKMINSTGFDKKQVYPQTIHNELIKDNRFVLVGRGMYGLKDQGYFPGTAKEVLKKLLKEKGPMNMDEIVTLVSQQRFLKENTILLNLQNRKHFKKLPDGKYHVA